MCVIYVGGDNDSNVQAMITRLMWTIWTSLSAVWERPLNLITHSLTPHKGPLMWTIDIFFIVSMNELWNKQSSCQLISTMLHVMQHLSAHKLSHPNAILFLWILSTSTVYDFHRRLIISLYCCMGCSGNNIWGLWYQKQISQAGVSNCTPQGAITYPCMRYLLIMPKSPYQGFCTILW